MTKRSDGPSASNAIPPFPAPESFQTNAITPAPPPKHPWKLLLTLGSFAVLALFFACMFLSIGAIELGQPPDTAATSTIQEVAHQVAQVATITRQVPTATTLAPTLSSTPTIAPTATPVHTTTATSAPIQIPSPTWTETSTATNTPSATSTSKPTLQPPSTKPPLPTIIPVSPWPVDTYYATTGANLRPCPQITPVCAPYTTLARGDPFIVSGIVRGEIVSGSAIWFEGTAVGGNHGFIHSSILATSNPLLAIPDSRYPTPLPYVPPPVYVPPPIVYPTEDPYIWELPSIQIPEEDSGVSGLGATAICRDGTYSYSANRRGTCSHHGGVSVWLR